MNRENVPSDSVSDYYKEESIIHSLLSELDSCIVEQSPLFTITNLLPKNVGDWSPAKISVKEVLDLYNPDISEEIRKLQERECLRWKTRWDRVHDPPATIVETPPHCHLQKFPNLFRAFTALLTLPINQILHFANVMVYNILSACIDTTGSKILSRLKFSIVTDIALFQMISQQPL